MEAFHKFQLHAVGISHGIPPSNRDPVRQSFEIPDHPDTAAPVIGLLWGRLSRQDVSLSRTEIFKGYDTHCFVIRIFQISKLFL